MAARGDICPKPVREAISIISPTIIIKGDTIVCPNSEEEYFVEPIAGANYQWEVSPNDIILEGQGTERIKVKWNSSESGYVKVFYENCFLGCSGMGELPVDIGLLTHIEGPIEICQNDNPVFSHKYMIYEAFADWKILDKNGSPVWSSAQLSAHISPTWDFLPGRYTIQANPIGSATCQAVEGLEVELLAPPPPIDSIIGETDICPGQIYNYTAASPLPNATFEWSIMNGGVVSQKEGKSINVVWGNQPPYSLFLVQKDWDRAGCMSLPLLMSINAWPTMSITGNATACRENSTTFNTQFFENMEYEWAVTPPQAGAVIEGQGTEEVTVFWQQTGTATLQMDACGATAQITVEVGDLSLPTVSHPIAICEGETATVSASDTYAFYVWKNENGQVVSTDAYPDLPPGQYSLTVEDQSGCSAETIFSIGKWPLPTAYISTPSYNAGICEGGLGVTLYALQTEGSQHYQWYKDGSPVGADVAQFQTFEGGIYHVVVSNQFGCQRQSNSIHILDCEDLGGECLNGVCTSKGDGTQCNIPGCEPDGHLAFDWSANACNSFSFENLSVNAVSGSFSWDFDDPSSGSNNLSNESSPTHLFSGPGYYTISLNGSVPNINDPDEECPLLFEADVMVPTRGCFRCRGKL